jgi:hypothetical protein
MLGSLRMAEGRLGTVLVSIDNLGAGPSYSGLAARLYEAAPLGRPPAHDGTDAWPVRAALATRASYLIADTWVGRLDGELVIELPSGQLPNVHLRILNPVVSMRLDRARRFAAEGTIAGVLATAALVSEVRGLMGSIDPSLCDGASSDDILRQMAQASDRLEDGTEDPRAICDGISIGLGFEAERAELGPIAAPEPPAPWPCSTGRRSGAGGSGLGHLEG